MSWLRQSCEGKLGGIYIQYSTFCHTSLGSYCQNSKMYTIFCTKDETFNFSTRSSLNFALIRRKYYRCQDNDFERIWILLNYFKNLCKIKIWTSGTLLSKFGQTGTHISHKTWFIQKDNIHHNAIWIKMGTPSSCWYDTVLDS